MQQKPNVQVMPRRKRMGEWICEPLPRGTQTANWSHSLEFCMIEKSTTVYLLGFEGLTVVAGNVTLSKIQIIDISWN